MALRPRLSVGLPLTVSDTMQKKPYEIQAPESLSGRRSPASAASAAGLMPLSASWGAKIAALESQAKAALKLVDLLRAGLPENEKNHLISAVYHEDTLVLTTDSAAWGTHLRYRENALREQLAAMGEKPFTNLKVRVGRP